MKRPPPPAGYEWTGHGMEIQLIDPVGCPAGHPIRWGQRGYAPCAQHHGHPTWTCRCGQVIYGLDGAFLAELPCRR
ncbi:hypothetical protein ABZS66_19285 [Dactylosporangium sp. NPDC005572]|uniref:hypothetical protein n=1 Tax=Dactylosporangium sp. NPDC005572 TaxID=3156889 RepID=UPI0033A69F11